MCVSFSGSRPGADRRHACFGLDPMKRMPLHDRTRDLGIMRPADRLAMSEPPADAFDDSTLALLDRARAGDAGALDILMARHLPRLQRWASGRLPQWARDAVDTTDLVQDTLLQTFKRIDRFEVRGEGALQAYLRQGILNRIRDEFRKARRRPAAAELDTEFPDGAASPLELAVGQEAIERYEAALQRLRAEDREAIIARVELGMPHEELARLLGKPSANAARMAVERALVRLAAEMGRARESR
jgi:RNA polymerase sigma factor (sigma-70 family)